jgi:S-methylmethionine-dependent homocysteine/selenocysteine methylase
MTETTPAKTLPQLETELFLADGGLETTLVFLDGFDLPEFAAFPLVEDGDGRAALERYYDSYLDVAEDAGVGIALDTPTWRANPDWAAKLGYDEEGVHRANLAGVDFVRQVRDRRGSVQVVVNGAIGPRGDGYVVDTHMSGDEAADYHSTQVRAFAEAGADLVTAVTMTYADEAFGVARAAEEAGVPVALSFTVETDGRLPSGESLADAVRSTDRATGGYPSYFMVNCAHPTHFAEVLDPSAAWTGRLAGIRANASTMSHAELDEAETLDAGDQQDLARRYAALRESLPGLRLLGGCCGTDARHVRAISEACLAAR